MDRTDFVPWEHEMLHAFVLIGREIALIAAQLHAHYLTVYLPIADGELVAFTWERGAPWVSGRGFDVELSAIPAWRGQDAR
jgi:hypothetical protein